MIILGRLAKKAENLICAHTTATTLPASALFFSLVLVASSTYNTQADGEKKRKLRFLGDSFLFIYCYFLPANSVGIFLLFLTFF